MGTTFVRSPWKEVMQNESKQLFALTSLVFIGFYFILFYFFCMQHRYAFKGNWRSVDPKKKH